MSSFQISAHLTRVRCSLGQQMTNAASIASTSSPLSFLTVWLSVFEMIPWPRSGTAFLSDSDSSVAEICWWDSEMQAGEGPQVLWCGSSVVDFPSQSSLSDFTGAIMFPWFPPWGRRRGTVCTCALGCKEISSSPAQGSWHTLTYTWSRLAYQTHLSQCHDWV